MLLITMDISGKPVWVKAVWVQAVEVHFALCRCTRSQQLQQWMQFKRGHQSGVALGGDTAVDHEVEGWCAHATCGARQVQRGVQGKCTRGCKMHVRGCNVQLADALQSSRTRMPSRVADNYALHWLQRTLVYLCISQNNTFAVAVGGGGAHHWQQPFLE